MDPYRIPPRIDARAAPAPVVQRTHSPRFVASVLLSPGALASFAGVLFSDGTELAVGSLPLAFGARRATALTLAARGERAALD